MQAGKKLKVRPKRKTRTWILKLLLALAVVLIVLAFFLVPAFVSSEKGRKIILAKINNSIDGEMDFTTLSMSWWKGIKVTDVSFTCGRANDSSTQISVTVKQIATKPHYVSLLMGSLSFGKTEIFEPKIEINLGHPLPKRVESYRQEPSADKKAQAIALPIKKIDLVVKGGNLKVTDRQAETIELLQINSSVNLRPPGQQTNFDIDMDVVDKGKESKIHADGQIVPKQRTGWSLKGTSGDFTVEVNDLDLASLGPIFALTGVEVQPKGLISANVKTKIKDGRFENLTGTIKGRDLDITAGQLKGDRLKSSRLDVAVKLQSKEELINIDTLEVHSDWLDAEASGVVPTTFESLAEFVKADSIYSLKASFECDLAAVLSQMPRTLGVKEGTKITSGQLSGNIETSTKAGQRQIHGQATLVGLEGAVKGRAIALSEPVKAEVEITSDEAGIINFDKLNVSAAFCKINCTGSSELLKYNANVNLAKLQDQLGQFIDIGQYRMAGELFSEGEVSGDKDKITVVGSSEIKDLRLSSAEGVSAFEPRADIDFSVALEPAKNILNVDFIKANATLGDVSIKDAVLPLNEKAEKPMELNVLANKIDLEKLQPFAVLFASFPKEMQLAGVAESNISISAENQSYRVVTDATEIKNLKVRYPGQKPFEQSRVSVIFDVEVNPTEKTLVVRKLRLISPQIKIHKGNFSRVSKGGKTKLQGQVDCEYDWAALGTVAGPFLPKGLKLAGQRKDTIDFSSEYPLGQTDKLLANLSTKTKLGFERAEYMGLNFGPTEVDIQIQNGLLRIAPFSTTVNNGRFKFAGQADFKQKPTLLATAGPIQILKDIQINDETTRKLLTYLNPVFANAVNVSGVANFYCERLAIPLAQPLRGAGLASTTRKDIEVIGTISINKLRLQAPDLLNQILSLAGTSMRGRVITIHPARFVLQNGFLRYDDMQMDVGDNPVNFKGVIGLDKSLNMTVTLPYTLKGRTARVGKEPVGERISLPLRGTTDKPELDVGKLLEEQLRKRLEQELQKGLEKLFE